MNNIHFSKILNKNKGKANERFYALDNDFIDTFELNEKLMDASDLLQP
jgi:hypothetical protein